MTQTSLIFKCNNGETITLKRPTAYDVFNANSLADMGNGNYKDTIYYNHLLVQCWDRGNTLDYLKNLDNEEGIRFHNLMRNFFDAKLSGDDIKKYNGQSTQEKSLEENSDCPSSKESSSSGTI